MKTTILQCHYCNATIEKATKEVRRRLKVRPEAKFYCSLVCSGSKNAEHLKGKSPFVAGSATHDRALAAAAATNTKYVGLAKTMNTILRKCRSRRHQKEFSITVEYLLDLWETQRGRCALSNIPLDLEAEDYVNMPSVDRIDSTKGYVTGNVQFVSCAINFAKSTMSDERVHALLRLVCENYSVNREA